MRPSRVSRDLRRGLAAAALLCLWACSPEYDWRLLNNGDDGFTVMYPAKPTLDERQINIGGRLLTMRIQAAKAGDAVFAVGVVTLPDADPALQASVMHYLESGLARNVGTSATPHPVWVRAGDAAQPISGEEFSAVGKVRNEKQERHVRARFAVRGKRVFQAVVIGEKTPPEEQIDQFFDSWKLY